MSVLLLAGAVLIGVAGFPIYQTRVPNGLNVNRNGVLWPGVGHENAAGGGPRNIFGLAFAAAGHEWTEALCKADSDGDGQSNGLELGDPLCRWSTNEVPQRHQHDISHPGFPDSKTSTVMPTTAEDSHETTTAMPITTSRSSELACTPSQLLIEDGSRSTYSCLRIIAPGVTLHWGTNGTLVNLALEKEETGGYLALGFPQTANTMVGANAFVALSDGVVQEYKLGGYTSSQVIVYSPGGIPIRHSSSSATVSQGTTVLRILGAEVSDPTNVQLLFSRRASDGFGQHQSGSDFRGGFALNALTGSVQQEHDTSGGKRQVWVVAHGTLQILAWAFLAPAAVLMKRLGASVLKGKTILCWPAAFFLHFTMMGLAIFITSIATVLAWTRFSHRTLYGHGAVGAAVFSVVLLQPLPALFLRPDAQKDPDRRRIFNCVHVGGGVSILLLAWVCTFLGIINYRDLWDQEGGAKPFLALASVGIAGTTLVYILARVAPSMCGQRSTELANHKETSPQLFGHSDA